MLFCILKQYFQINKFCNFLHHIEFIICFFIHFLQNLEHYSTKITYLFNRIVLTTSVNKRRFAKYFSSLQIFLRLFEGRRNIRICGHNGKCILTSSSRSKINRLNEKFIKNLHANAIVCRSLSKRHGCRKNFDAKSN